MRGSGFPPGKDVQIGGRPIDPNYQDVVYQLPKQAVAPDGTFAIEFSPFDFACQAEALQISIWAVVSPRDGVTPDMNARYTIASTPPPYPSGPYLATPIRPGPATPATPATPTRGTPTPPASPPAGILAYGDETQTGALGNYCWRAGWRATGSCAERGLPIPPATFAVPRGVTLRFAAPGVPTMLLNSAAVYPLPARPATGTSPALILFAADPSGRTIAIPDTLPPGGYALIVRAGPGWGGEVTYGFHLAVR